MIKAAIIFNNGGNIFFIYLVRFSILDDEFFKALH